MALPPFLLLLLLLLPAAVPCSAAGAAAAQPAAASPPAPSPPIAFAIDLAENGSAFPHYWERCVGSGRGLGSIIWGQQTGSKGTRLAETERGVWFWLGKGTVSVHPIP